MRTFTEKQSQPQKAVFSSAAKSTIAASLPDHRALLFLTLQRTVGNKTMQRLLHDNPEAIYINRTTVPECGFGRDFNRITVPSKSSMVIQPKLTISTPGDYGEQEADRVAEEVMRIPDGPPFQAADRHQDLASPPALQRACGCGSQFKSDENGVVRRWPLLSLSSAGDNVVARAINFRALADSMPDEEISDAVEETDEEAAQTNEVNRKAAGLAATREVAQPTVTPQLSKAINTACQSGGQPLSPQIRQFMEPRFGYDFSAVRIHTDRAAGEMAHQIQARAFTTGNSIFFAPGEFQPDQKSGKHLLAHELAHVVQQGKGNSGVGRQIQRSGNGGANCPPYASYDKSADLKKYNCAGLAHRSYDFKSLVDTNAILSSATKVACGTPCDHIGVVKHWLWVYDVHYQDSNGTTAAGQDFHTVGGPTDGDPAPKDSDEFFSKNGKRPVYGPGTAPSFKPPAKEQATLSDPSEAPQFDKKGNPIYKLRSNFKESCFCIPCPKATKAP
jgi:Domain of unknown function (DUF4157)